MRDEVDHAAARRAQRTLLTAQAVSEAGDFVGLAALVLLAYGRSGSVIGAAAVFAVKAIPALLVGTVWGTLLDRPERRAGLVALALVGAVIVGGVAAWPSLALALVGSALLQAARTSSISITAGTVVDLIPSAERGRFFTRSNVIGRSATVLGFMLGATGTTAIGARPALAFDAATFLVAALLLTRLPRVPPRARERRPSPLAGITTILQQPVLRLVSPVIWVGVLGGMLPETLAPLVAHGAMPIAIVMAAMPAGSLAASLVVRRIGVLDAVHRQLVAAALFGASFLVGALTLWLHTGWGGIAAANVLVGATSIWVIGARTTFALRTPPERMSQVEATIVSSITLSECAGALLLASIALASAGLSYALAGAFSVTIALAALRRERRLPIAAAAESPAAAG